MELADTASSSFSNTASSSSSVIAPLSSSSSNAVPAPKMVEPSNAEDLKIWPATLEKQFIDILLEAAAKGTTPNGKGKMKNKYWPSVTANFNNRTGKRYSLLQITEKFKQLKKRHRVFSQLIRRPGMEWDRVTNTDIGSDTTWSEVVALNRRCSDFCKKGLDLYELLGQLIPTVAQTSFAQSVSVDDVGSNPKGKQPTHFNTSTGLKRKAGSLNRTTNSAQVPDPFSMARDTKILESMDLDNETFFKALTN